MKVYACIDIGGTAVKYGVLDQKLNIIGKWETPSRAAEGKEALVKQIREIAAFLFEQGQTICGIAISSAGVVDSERACILHANESIPGYIGTDWKEELAGFGVPVEADNDVNCAGLCEYETGAGQGSRSMLMVTIGTGIGGCFVENGHLMHGHSSSACEIGYIPVDGMQFQHQASTTALVRDVAALKRKIRINGTGAGSLSWQKKAIRTAWTRSIGCALRSPKEWLPCVSCSTRKRSCLAAGSWPRKRSSESRSKRISNNIQFPSLPGIRGSNLRKAAMTQA